MAKTETSVRDGDSRPGDLVVSEKMWAQAEPVGRPEDAQGYFIVHILAQDDFGVEGFL